MLLLLSLNSLLHLNSWFYFLILIDELLANAAGNYLLKGKKFGINFEGNRSRLDVLASHTQTETRSYLHKRRNLERDKSPGGLLFGAARKDPDLESGKRKTEARADRVARAGAPARALPGLARGGVGGARRLSSGLGGLPSWCDRKCAHPAFAAWRRLDSGTADSSSLPLASPWHAALRPRGLVCVFDLPPHQRPPPLPLRQLVCAELWLRKITSLIGALKGVNLLHCFHLPFDFEQRETNIQEKRLLPSLMGQKCDFLTSSRADTGK
ncbi:uncharacterized protein [Dasypus novemcinctus]|uniref:uncharacterized protein n=1 Tax=Dasypus novemcinctus TaxID=9361 RepID=UPI0039C9CD4F